VPKSTNESRAQRSPEPTRGQEVEYICSRIGIGELVQREQSPFRQESGGVWRKDEARSLVVGSLCVSFSALRVTVSSFDLS